MIPVWVSEKDKKRKINYGKKQTFIDTIINQPKEKKIPGPGAYNLLKTAKEIEDDSKKLKTKKGTSM